MPDDKLLNVRQVPRWIPGDEIFMMVLKRCQLWMVFAILSLMPSQGWPKAQPQSGEPIPNQVKSTGSLRGRRGLTIYQYVSCFRGKLAWFKQSTDEFKVPSLVWGEMHNNNDTSRSIWAFLMPVHPPGITGKNCWNVSALQLLEWDALSSVKWPNGQVLSLYYECFHFRDGSSWRRHH